MNIKQIIISAGIVLGFIAILIGIIFVLGTIKSGGNKTSGVSSPQASDDNMASHHASPAPADNSIFKSLLDQKAPDFNLESFGGQSVRLSDLGGKNVVLFFSEGAMCYPSCWDQINAFTKDKGFSDKNAVVLMVVVDPKTDWEEVVKKDPKLASATVLLDSDRKVSNDYGVLTVDSSMHRGQFPGHTYIVIDREGIVRYELDDPQMGINNSQLLAQISKL